MEDLEMMRMPRLVTLFLFVIALTLIAACSPTPAQVPLTQPPAATQVPAATGVAQPTQPPAEQPTTAASSPTEAATTAAPAGTKTLTIGMSQEPRGLGVLTAQVAAIE